MSQRFIQRYPTSRQELFNPLPRCKQNYQTQTQQPQYTRTPMNPKWRQERHIMKRKILESFTPALASKL